MICWVSKIERKETYEKEKQEGFDKSKNKDDNDNVVRYKLNNYVWIVR